MWNTNRFFKKHNGEFEHLCNFIVSNDIVKKNSYSITKGRESYAVPLGSEWVTASDAKNSYQCIQNVKEWNQNSVWMRDEVFE